MPAGTRRRAESLVPLTSVLSAQLSPRVATTRRPAQLCRSARRHATAPAGSCSSSGHRQSWRLSADGNDTVRRRARDRVGLATRSQSSSVATSRPRRHVVDRTRGGSNRGLVSRRAPNGPRGRCCRPASGSPRSPRASLRIESSCFHAGLERGPGCLGPAFYSYRRSDGDRTRDRTVRAKSALFAALGCRSRRRLGRRHCRRFTITPVGAVFACCAS